MSNPTQVVTGNTTQTRPENRVLYPALDGLRAVAFTMVFLQHYLNAPWGWTGVNVFFVLSGFLITGILYDTRDETHRVRNFYVRRTLRIFPLYYGIFLALLVLSPVLHWRWSAAWWAWPLYLGNYLRFVSPAAADVGTPLQAAANAWLISPRLHHTVIYMGHFWSLCVEEQFYLAWPWIVFFVRSRRALLWICSMTVVAVPIARVLLQHSAPAWMLHGELLYRFTFLQLDSLLLGALIALLWRGAHRQALLRLSAVVAPVMIVAALLFTAVHLFPLTPDNFLLYPYPSWKFSLGLSYINVLSAAVILCCLRSQGVLFRLLKLAPLRWLGRISYGAYVLHDLLHDLFYHLEMRLFRSHPLNHNPEVIAVALVAFPGTLLAAWLSFRYFESPFLNLKERWTIRAS